MNGGGGDDGGGGGGGGDDGGGVWAGVGSIFYLCEMEASGLSGRPDPRPLPPWHTPTSLSITYSTTPAHTFHTHLFPSTMSFFSIRIVLFPTWIFSPSPFPHRDLLPPDRPKRGGGRKKSGSFPTPSLPRNSTHHQPGRHVPLSC